MMAKPKSRSAMRQNPPEGWIDPLAPKQPLISPKWLVKALLLSLAGASVCAYFALGLLFWQGQWQLLYHPSKTVQTTPATADIPFEDVRFGTTEAGETQLTGWWIPALKERKYSQQTLLFLHDGSGSIGDTLPYVALLHNLGINLLVFDYRGFGQSKQSRPSEDALNQDAEAALTYLSETRHVPLNAVVLYGKGIGASIAVTLAEKHHALPALILDNPSRPALEIFKADKRTEILPMSLLLHDRFELAKKVPNLKQPKLFLSDMRINLPVGYEEAASPKTLIHLQAPLANDPATELALRRFLDDSL